MMPGAQSLTCDDIPELDTSILPSTDEELPVRTESNGTHQVGMSLQNLTAGTSADIPKPHGIIFTPTGNHGPVGTKYDRPDPVRVAAKCTNECSIGGIPNTDLTIITSRR